MTEKPPPSEDLKEKSKKLCEETGELPEKSAWEQDQKARGYYYDDAHGYEVFNPNEGDERDED